MSQCDTAIIQHTSPNVCHGVTPAVWVTPAAELQCMFQCDTAVIRHSVILALFVTLALHVSQCDTASHCIRHTSCIICSSEMYVKQPHHMSQCDTASIRHSVIQP